MKLVRVAAAVLNQTPLDWHGNQANIVSAIQQAKQQQASILCLPELCISGYGCEDAFHSRGVHQMSLRVLREIVPQTQGLIVSVGLPLWHAGGLFNTACLISDQVILGFVGKQNLAGEGIHYEPRWFKRWPDDVQTETEIEGRSYPLGDLVFDCGGVLIGFEICEDAWVAERPGGELARRGVDLILNPSASHFAFDKNEVRQRFVLEGSRAFKVSYVYSNLLGNEAGRAIYDGEAMIASDGKMLALGSRFSFADVQLTTAVIDIDATRMSRARTGSFRPQIDDQPVSHVTVEFNYPRIEPQSQTARPDPWEDSADLKCEEFTRAVALALFDYMRKSRSHGFVVSISGGADSAAVATLCSLLVHLGLDELGHTAFVSKLAYLPNLPKQASADAIVGALLTCAYQATRHSSETTLAAAQGVAAAIGARFIKLDVDEQVQAYIRMIEQALGRELTWETDDLTLQNIQARTRSPSIWMLANIFNALLLSTSNRSEAAVGYATMDGDTSGGLSPIAGIDKAFLRQWLHWMEVSGPVGLGPVKALSAVNVQQPTAELRPSEMHQTDEADLMPYTVLDAIERAAIRDKQTPLEAFRILQTKFPDATVPEVHQWVERFFRLWCRNQWKRERYAPSFHLDDENLDPKTWCRFPILSGGFQRELAELRQYVSELASG